MFFNFLSPLCFSYGVWLSRELVNALAIYDGFYPTNTPLCFTRNVPQAHAPRPLIVWDNNWNVWLSDYMYAFRNVVNIQGSLRKVAVIQQETTTPQLILPEFKVRTAVLVKSYRMVRRVDR